MQVFLAILTLLKPSGLPNFNKLESWEMVIQEPSYIQCFVIPYCQEKKFLKKNLSKCIHCPSTAYILQTTCSHVVCAVVPNPLRTMKCPASLHAFFISVACIKSVYLSVAKSRPSKKMSLKGTKKGSLLVKRGTFLKLLNAHKSGHTFSWSDCKK